MRWAGELLQRLIALRAAGAPLSQCARELGASRSSVIGAWYRYANREKWIRRQRDAEYRAAQRMKYRIASRKAGIKPQTPRHPVRWTDDVLTETWAERKARREAEAARG